jgi:hypothetical protein
MRESVLIESMSVRAWSAPIWKGYRPLCMGAGKVSGDALCKMVAIEAIAVYCSKPGSQNGNPE